MRNPFGKRNKNRRKSDDDIMFQHAQFDNGISVTAERVSRFGRWNVEVKSDGFTLAIERYVDGETLANMFSVYECAPNNYAERCLYAMAEGKDNG